MGTYEPNQEDISIRALAFELKNPLVNIARRAELGDENALKDIQVLAEQNLSLIDSFLLTAQTEYGQVALDLEPASVGSILYDASVQLQHQQKNRNVSILLDDRTHEPVMTHRPAITSVLSVFGNILLSIRKTTNHQELILKGYKAKNGKMGIGIFSHQVELSQKDLDNALMLQGKAHMPLSNVSSTAHVSLLIASGLCRSLGGKVQVRRIGGLSGLATEMPPSVQLSLI